MNPWNSYEYRSNNVLRTRKFDCVFICTTPQYWISLFTGQFLTQSILQQSLRNMAIKKFHFLMSIYLYFFPIVHLANPPLTDVNLVSKLEGSIPETTSNVFAQCSVCDLLRPSESIFPLMNPRYCFSHMTEQCLAWSLTDVQYILRSDMASMLSGSSPSASPYACHEPNALYLSRAAWSTHGCGIQWMRRMSYTHPSSLARSVVLPQCRTVGTPLTSCTMLKRFGEPYMMRMIMSQKIEVAPIAMHASHGNLGSLRWGSHVLAGCGDSQSFSSCGIGDHDIFDMNLEIDMSPWKDSKIERQK